jgi:hypothetical protein
MALAIGALMCVPGVAWILLSPNVPAAGPAPVPSDTGQAEAEAEKT